MAGNGTGAFAGDLGMATAAEINNPNGVAVDAIGNVYIADFGNYRIRKVDTFGVITTIAGTGVMGFGGDGGPATAALIHSPTGIAIDGSGNVLFTDACRIRKINTATGVISTIAGSSLASYSGDGGPAVAADLNYPVGIAVDGPGNIYIADQFNCRVRKINTSGIISTIAGTGICFGGGDGGPATAARVQYPLGVACDGMGNVFIADYGNNRIRRINPAGIIDTIAGSPIFGFTGDGGPAIVARLYYPMAIATDVSGNVYISDVNNSRIREINTAGIINTIIGTGVDGYSGDGGPPTAAQINRSTGIAIGPAGKIYISDNYNNRIRVVHLPTHEPFFTRGVSASFTTCPDKNTSLDTLLTVSDIDTGQTETWSVVLAPLHGTLLASYLALSTGGILLPVGQQYIAGSTYSGPDSFKVQVNDGTFSDTITIYVTIMSLPVAGTITGIDSICPGDTLTFHDTVSGGSWTSATPTVATIDTVGFATAHAHGLSVIIYTVSNLCGSTAAVFNLYVRSDCPNGVRNINSVENRIVVFPNPGSGAFTISLVGTDVEEVQFTITNVVGEKVKTFRTVTNNAVTINLDEPLGIYFLSAAGAKNMYFGKITIAR
jgi:Secretion system C-terminal sorting domain/NHL repeat